MDETPIYNAKVWIWCKYLGLGSGRHLWDILFEEISLLGLTIISNVKINFLDFFGILNELTMNFDNYKVCKVLLKVS